MLRDIIVKVPDTVIGVGAIGKLGDIARGFKPGKILVVTDKVLAEVGIIDAVKRPLAAAGLRFEIFDDCKPEPSIQLLDELANKVREGGYDLLIGVGGGSNMDTTKIVSTTALSGLTVKDYIGTFFHQKIAGRIIPKILIPTTAGTGAEWSVITTAYSDHVKYIVKAWENLPDKVIIDPELTVTMPPRTTADTGIDALTHAIEAYTSPLANIFSDMLAGNAIKMISENFRRAYTKGKQDIDARYNMSVAAAFAMNASNSSSIGLSHFMGAILGSRVHISHGTSICLTLPHVMEYNLISNPGRFAKVAELMGENISGLSADAAAARSVDAVKRLIKDVGLPSRLKEVGITEADIPQMARKCYETDAEVISSCNPRKAAEKDIALIFKAAL